MNRDIWSMNPQELKELMVKPEMAKEIKMNEKVIYPTQAFIWDEAYSYDTVLAESLPVILETEPVIVPYVSQTDSVFQVARDYHLDGLKIIGHGDMITEPTQADGWNICTFDQFHREIPTEAIGKINRLLLSGVINAEDILVLDDVRHIRITESPPPLKVKMPKIKTPNVDWGRVLETTGEVAFEVLKFTGKVAWGILKVAGYVVGGLVMLTLGALCAALTGDPILAVRTSDGDIIEIHRWYD